MSTENELINEENEKKRKAEELEEKLAQSQLNFEKRKKQQQEQEEVDQSAESFYSRRLKTQDTQQHEKPAILPIEQSAPLPDKEKGKALNQMVDKILAAVDKNMIAMGDANSRMLMKNMRPFLNVTHEKITLMEPPDDENIKQLVAAGKAAFGEKVILICFDPAKKDFMQAQAKKHGVDFADTPAKLAELKAQRDGKQVDNNLPLEPPHIAESKEKALKREVMDRLVKATLERAANNKVSKNDKPDEPKEEQKEKRVRFADDEKPNDENDDNQASFRPS